MRETPPVSAKLKALQDAMGAQLERQQKAKEKESKADVAEVISVQPNHREYVPTIEDEYLMAQFQHGRYCGD